MPFARTQITEEQAQKIIEETRLKNPPENAAKSLQAKLNEALSKYEIHCDLTKNPETSKQLHDDVKCLKNNLEKVLKSLRVSKYDDGQDFSIEHPYLFHYLDRAASRYDFHNPEDPFGSYVLSAVEGIIKFSHLVDQLSKTPDLIPAETRIKLDTTSLQYLLGHLLPEVYQDVFKKDFGYSRPPNGGKPKGPGIKFIKSVIEIARINTSDKEEAIASHIDRYKKQFGKASQKKS